MITTDPNQFGERIQWIYWWINHLSNAVRIIFLPFFIVFYVFVSDTPTRVWNPHPKSKYHLNHLGEYGIYGDCNYHILGGRYLTVKEREYNISCFYFFKSSVRRRPIGLSLRPFGGWNAIFRNRISATVPSLRPSEGWNATSLCGCINLP